MCTCISSSWSIHLLTSKPNRTPIDIVQVFTQTNGSKNEMLVGQQSKGWKWKLHIVHVCENKKCTGMWELMLHVSVTIIYIHKLFIWAIIVKDWAQLFCFLLWVTNLQWINVHCKHNMGDWKVTLTKIQRKSLHILGGGWYLSRYQARRWTWKREWKLE